MVDLSKALADDLPWADCRGRPAPSSLWFEVVSFHGSKIMGWAERRHVANLVDGIDIGRP